MAANMAYNFLGKSGLKVSNICLGTMTFGSSDGYIDFFTNKRQLTEEQSHQIMDRFVELGGNFLDTANVYSFGKSEEVIGTWLQKQQRDKMIVATKTRFPLSITDQNGMGLSRRTIVQNCEGSLKRLQTDYIDLYQAHAWDNGTPIEETLRTFDDLIRAGKIRYYGFSNVCGWQLQKIVDTAKEFGLNHCISLQQQYSMLIRHSEYEAFMVCKNEGIGVLPWSPLKSGMLTGKFKRGETPDKDSSRIGILHAKENQPGKVPMNRSWDQYGQDDAYWTLIDTIRDIAKTHEKSIPQVALRWLLQKEEVSSVIIGVTSMSQLEDNMGAATGWKLSDEEMSTLDKLSPREEFYPYSSIWDMMINGPDRYNIFANYAKMF